MNNELLNKLIFLKEKYLSDGFIVIGYFGSYSRNENTDNSDIDILYCFSEDFHKKYIGWDVYTRLEEIELDFENQLGCKVDFANRDALNEVSRKYILPEVNYV